MSEDMLTYLHLLDIDNPDKSAEVYRLLDRELSVGMIIEKSVTEGYIPYEVISYTHIDKVFGDKDLYQVKIKKHPFVKTHCDHDWEISNSQQIIIKFFRICKKCNTKEEFEYGTAKWSKINDTK
jgi:hypothetical protein